MDVENNHLIDGKIFAKMMKENPRIANRYTPLPDHLQDIAKEALDGQNETTIDFKSKSPLAKWAKKLRKKLNIEENK